MNAALDAGVGHGRRDALSWYAYLLLGYFSYILNIQGNVLPFVQDELGLSYRDASLNTSAIAADVILVGLAGERAIRVLGRRRVLLAAVLGSATGAVLLTLAPSAVASIGACLLFGTLGAFIPAMVPAILSDVHGPGQRDVAFAEANAVACLFSTAGPIVMAAVIALGLGWRAAVLAGVGFGLALVATFARSRVPASPDTREASRAPLGLAFWCYFVLIAMGVGTEFSALIWAPAYLEQNIGLAPSEAAIGATAFFAGMLIGRVGGAGVVRFAPLRPLLGLAATLLFAGFALYWLPTDPIPVIAGLFVVGLGVALLYPIGLSFAINAAGPAAERAAARALMAPGLAILLAPALLGAIADHVGLRLALLVTPACMLLGLVAFAAGEIARRRPA